MSRALHAADTSAQAPFIRISQNGWGLLAVARGRYVLVGVISGRKTRPLYGVEGWPRNRGFVSTISIAMRSGPR